MVVNDNARVLGKRGVFESIASELAPTGFDGDLCAKALARDGR
ncbi:hypothetical protein SAMN04490203_2441 [Pseudomonas taetrolens]|uniref:Uncharacterized protein n=1 Tax=Pseudomonas taetrolens TaxID=47884 RepID=A0A1H4SMN4_PSETA|nr:hypothetical protein SAMN04490203_2441 [Pseudomonas taetrolens]SQF86594.1 Uncharacterised protein [Pseudomonas taetrolens]VEH49670.1 Uncharacterised protein [Pseudomonas taetrolens]